MEHISDTVLGLTGLLALAVLMLPVAGRMNFPYTVLLAAAGVLLGIVVLLVDPRNLGIVGDFLAALHGFEITSDGVLFMFLPALVFEAALHINVRRWCSRRRCTSTCGGCLTTWCRSWRSRLSDC